MDQSQGTGQHYTECATCTNYSKFYWNTCHQRICEQCREDHLNKKENINHEVVLYQDRAKELPKQNCKVHPTKMIDLGCIDCKCFLCPKCFALYHNGHRMLDLEIAYNESFKYCQKEMIEIQDTILPQIKQNLQIKKENVVTVKKEITEVRLSMKKRAEEIIKAIETIFNDNNSMLDRIEKICAWPHGNRRKRDRRLYFLSGGIVRKSKQGFVIGESF
ncbi:RING finger protein 207-like [Saccostrea echinata]|uniref:RING finger protein 207-like n=1 Tax=Saccostrea echinata TaxID=191078 RepID=UPI002A831717|nr:RING finger protein 207-like [Saccostrea echinata]